MKKSTLTLEALKEVLAYDPETGAFTWKVVHSNRAKVGGIAGAVASNGRRYISVAGEKHMAHRLAWFYVHGAWPTGNIIAKNDDYLDSRIDNLIEESIADTARKGKARLTSASGIKGVTWEKARGKWLATITRNYRHVTLGRFDTKEEAAAAYERAARELRGDSGSSEILARAEAVSRRRRQRLLWERTKKAAHGIVGWASIEEFIADVGSAPPANQVIVPVDVAKPVGPGNFAWDSPLKDGFDLSTREGRIAYNRAHRAANPLVYRDKELRRNFGITLAEYEAMLEAQGGVCAICRNSESEMREGKLKALAVDHDHETGAVRALLCADCNKMIGHAREEVSRLRAAIAYIERHKITTKPTSVEVKVEFPTNFRTHALRDCGRVAA